VSGAPRARKREAAEAIMRRILAGGPVRCREVNEALRAAGISEQTAWRARQRVGVRRSARPRPGPGAVWWVELR
jgi:hypothetical protein